MFVFNVLDVFVVSVAVQVVAVAVQVVVVVVFTRQVTTAKCEKSRPILSQTNMDHQRH